MCAAKTTGMYKVKPIIDFSSESIPLPKVMYEMPKIQGGDISGTAADIIHQMPGLDQLEARQMRILKQICDLKTQIEYLNIATRVSDNKSNTGSHKINFNQVPIDTEVIIYANPLSPPYFIPAIQRIWKDININVKTYCHSSVSGAETGFFKQKLLPESKNNVNSINITLIWKKVPEVQLVTKVYDYPLEGEANVLRFLTRLVEKYTYENLSESNLIDLLLDLCLQIFYEEPKNINSITLQFAQYLGKNGWFLNFPQPSIVDVAIWSTIKRRSKNKVPRELINWNESCEKLFLS